MMFSEFQQNFSHDNRAMVVDSIKAVVPDIIDLPELLSSFGGMSFAGGLYRIIDPSDLEVWNARVLHAFPQFEKRIVCFGYDWLGSVFALDSGRHEGGQPGVVMFEPGTGEALEIPSNILTFHNKGLAEFGEAALAISFYHEWLAYVGQRPSISQCVGYRIPLFVGGKDSVENLEISDVDVYWHLMGQLIREALGRPEGTATRKSAGDGRTT